MIYHFSLLDYVIIGYLVMLGVVWFIAHSKLGGPEKYRMFFSFIAGVFWPIPAAVFIALCIEGLIYDIANWLTRRN